MASSAFSKKVFFITLALGLVIWRIFLLPTVPVQPNHIDTGMELHSLKLPANHTEEHYEISEDSRPSPFGGEYNSTRKPENGLSLDDFEVQNIFHPYADSNRFLSQDAWRPQELYQTDNLATFAHKIRPKLPGLEFFSNKAQYLRQPLVAEFAPNSDKIFLMIKTGSTVLWNRLPLHTLTTLTKVPYYAIYSDMANSVGGHEVIDILANVTTKTKKSNDFKLYNQLQKLRNRNAMVDPKLTDLKGGWEMDKYKNIPMLAHALKVAPNTVDWFVFIDADTYLFVDNMINYLTTLNAKDKLYLGSIASFNNTNFAHGGSGVAISRAALEESIGKHPEWEHELEEVTVNNCCGDAMVAEMLKKADIFVSPNKVDEYPYAGKRFQGEPVYGLDANAETWCQQVFTFHHIRPSEIELLWEYERLIGPERRKKITYYDIYRDFYLPYIRPIMPGWNNLAKFKQFSKAIDMEEDAEKTKEAETKALEEIRIKEELEASEALSEEVVSAEEDEALQGGKSKQDEKKDQKDSKAKRDKKDDKKDSKDNKKNKKPEPKKKTDAEMKEEVEQVLYGDRPWFSQENCERECNLWDECLSWRYIPNAKYCGLGRTLKFGRPHLAGLNLNYWTDESKWDLTKIVSGFMISRIREMRINQECDALYGLKNDPDSARAHDYEGWYANMQDNDETKPSKE